MERALSERRGLRYGLFKINTFAEGDLCAVRDLPLEDPEQRRTLQGEVK
jgi:hypothetical protein